MDIFNYLKDNFKIYTVEECKELKDKGAYGFIYITQCKVNGKMYIGQKKFNYGFETYLGSGVLFTRAVDKYGKENFERIILQIAYSKEELNDYEIKYIELFDASEKYNRDLFYNIALGGNVIGLKGEDNPNYGKPLSEEHRKKISEANKGQKHSEEARKKMSEGHKGKELSEEHRMKISEAHKGENNPNYGKSPSEETRKKQSEAMKGRELSEEHKKKIGKSNKGRENKKNKGIKNGQAKILICIFPDGRIIKNCIKGLAEELNISKDMVKIILESKKPYAPNKKRLKHLEGIIIMFQEDYLKENTNQNINKIDNKAS